MGHIHAVIHPFSVFTAVKLTQLILSSGIRAHSFLPNFFEFLCRSTGRVTRLCGRSLGRIAGRVSGTLFVSIREAEVNGFVRINGVDIHLGRLGEGGRFVDHKPPG